MKPVKFKAANTIVNGEIPVNKDCGILLSRWKLNWRERLSVLWYGKVWLAVPGDDMPPILLSGNQSFEIKRNGQ